VNGTVVQHDRRIGARAHRQTSTSTAGRISADDALIPGQVERAEEETAGGASRDLENGSWAVSRYKRVFDLWIAFCALVLLSPLMILTAIAVKLSSKGPALFRQDRMGKGSQKFTLYKFRTMRALPPGSGPLVTKVGDMRLTRVGRILRSTKLDELPQLLNVLLGDMSLVGPRPKVPDHQTYELNVLPGITGAASIAFRKEETVLHAIPEHLLDDYQVNVMMPVKKALDDEYARTATFSSDLALLMRTVFGSGELIDLDGIHNFRCSLFSLGRAIENFGHYTVMGHKAPLEACADLALEHNTDGRQNREQPV
jgi:lipopolysaccharide/colanic/teichoic acid biosynthesis glycosyltransferase